MFDFIRPDVAKLILDAQIQKIVKTMHTEKQIELTIAEAAHEELLKAALGNLNNGGRGIGNIVESHLINPLARFLFDNDAYENVSVSIEGIDTATAPVSLKGSIKSIKKEADR